MMAVTRSKAKATSVCDEPRNEISLNERLQKFLRERNWIVALILIPISLIYDVVAFVRFRLEQAMSQTSTKHQVNVKKVQQQVREWAETDQSVPMCTARPAWKTISLQPMTYKSRLHKITMDLPNILSLKEDVRTVLVEPMVTVGLLNDYLVNKGWMLPIVPELDDLTIGGLVMGGGIETTSKRYGLFHYICLGYEVVLADSSVIWCDKDHHTDLFNCIPFSYGTLGFLTAVELKIVPYRPYLKMTYHPANTLKEALQVMEKGCRDPEVDTVEGIIYTKEKSVIMTGKFVDSGDVGDGVLLNRMGRWYKPWFYTHVETFLEAKEAKTEVVPTLDYFHRHNKSWFWLMEDHISCANHPIFRWLLGWTLPIKYTLLKWLNSLISQKVDPKFVLQDFGFNIRDVEVLIAKLDVDAKIYPIWLCPFLNMEDCHLQDGGVIPKGEILVDIGVYGHSPVPGFDNEVFQKKYEAYCLENRGAVALYARTMLTREDLEKMMFHMLRHYDRLRKEYGCQKAFPHVYYKISCEGRE